MTIKIATLSQDQRNQTFCTHQHPLSSAISCLCRHNPRIMGQTSRSKHFPFCTPWRCIHRSDWKIWTGDWNTLTSTTRKRWHPITCMPWFAMSGNSCACMYAFFHLRSMGWKSTMIQWQDFFRCSSHKGEQALVQILQKQNRPFGEWCQKT